MAGIAGSIHWDKAPVSRDAIARMLEAARHRGPDGSDIGVRANAGFGHLKLVLNERDRTSRQPLWSPDGAFAIVGDIRLYNRRELVRALGTATWSAGQPSDAELVLAAFCLWPTNAVQHLRGDFAFVIWDARNGRLRAYRDPFGVKPIFYAADANRFYFASEAKQILDSGCWPINPDDVTLARLLANAWPEAGERTFFAGIRRLLPGHSLEATAGRIQTSRWWNPPTYESCTSIMQDDEYAEGFRELLNRAVDRRLVLDCAAGLELSGGFDSSAIVLLAADVAKSRTSSSSLVTISQHYPGMSCDESEFIASVLDRCPFRAIHFDAPINDYSPRIDEELDKVEAPYPDTAWLRRRTGLELLRQQGCRVLVTGLGGDEVVWDPDYELDLWRTGQYARAITYCLRDPRVLRGSDQAACMGRLARFAAPASVRRRLGKWFKVRHRRDRDWLVQLNRAAETALNAEPEGTHYAHESLAQSAILRWLGAPSFRWVLESEEVLTAHHGLELRHPFLDRDLVEFVLSIPWDVRYRLPGAFKCLLASAMGSRMPALISTRAGKTTFDDYFRRLEGQSWPSIENRVFDSMQWAASRFVDRDLLDACRDSIRHLLLAGSPEAQHGWLALMTEIWLRRLSLRAAGTAFHAEP